MLQKDNQSLFVDQRISEKLHEITVELVQEINNLPIEQLHNNDDVLFKYFLDKYKILHLSLDLNKRSLTHEEDLIDMSHDYGRHRRFDGGPPMDPGLNIRVIIPYNGNSFLWYLLPKTRSSAYPSGNPLEDMGNEGILEIVVRQSTAQQDAKQKIKSIIDGNISLINQYIDFQKKDIDKFNSDLENTIIRAINRRKEHLGNIEDIVEFLEIPIEKKDDVLDFRPIEVAEKIVQQLPDIKQPNISIEYGITGERYDFILDFIRHVCRTFERTPKTFYIHDEEGLRDIILAFLNSYFKGKATGETFRNKGKTDILIEEEDRAAFVAECKVWNSEKKLLESINQLLGYLTWRDCKTSLIIFNKKNSKFEKLLTKIPETLEKHLNYHSTENSNHDIGEWRYKFHLDEDRDMVITVHVFLINIYFKTTN